MGFNELMQKEARMRVGCKELMRDETRMHVGFQKLKRLRVSYKGLMQEEARKRAGCKELMLGKMASKLLVDGRYHARSGQVGMPLQVNIYSACQTAWVPGSKQYPLSIHRFFSLVILAKKISEAVYVFYSFILSC